MDGTIFDTERQYIKSWLDAAEALGFDLSEKQVFACCGLPHAKVERLYLDYYGEDFDFSAFYKEKCRRVEKMWEEEGIAIKDGFFELMEYCDKNNIPRAIATSTARSTAEYMLKRAGVEKFFDACVCCDEIENGKPNPDIFLEAAKRIGVPAEQCVCAEDSKNGIIAAHAAKTVSVFIPDAIAADDEIRSAADYVFENLADIITLLN